MVARLPILEMAACADLCVERARASEREFGVPAAPDVESLLADDTLEIVLNLTVPQAHAPLTLSALESGKHVFVEKPLGIGRAEGEAILRKAGERGLRVGCAPDTFLGSGIQTCRKLIDDGAIGRPVGFTALMLCRGHESWHPSPEFYYEAGGGPMFDMGPYYLTALLNLLGPVRRYAGYASIAIPERTITSEPKRGQRIQVEVPDHVSGLLEFEQGAVGSLTTSFAVAHGVYDRSHPIVVYGTEGALQVPDPNMFDGAVLVRGLRDDEWREVPPQFLTGYGRAVGLADLAAAIHQDRPHRASLEQAFTVLDLMQGFHDSSESGGSRTPALHYDRPAPMPQEGRWGEL
jgi:predicted dehydrogenase